MIAAPLSRARTAVALWSVIGISLVVGWAAGAASAAFVGGWVVVTAGCQGLVSLASP